MTYYELLKFVHILMAVTWVGGAILIQILAARILRENDPHRLAGFAHDAGFLGQRVFAPVSGILVLMGILMVIDSWSFSDTWIIIGIVGFVATLVTGLFYLGPTATKLGDLLEQRGPEDPGVRPLLQRLLMISRIDLVVLILVIFNMVTKPGT